MRRVYTAENMILVGQVQGVLEAAGLKCQIRNQHLAGAMGGLPFDQCWPEIWVGDQDEERALRLIQREQRFTEVGADWTCDACGETVEAPLTQCWNCSAVQQAP
jgi:Putative prokaryotic signal transducing protein